MRRAWSAFLAGLLGLSLSLAASPAQDHFETARKLMAKGRMQDARVELKVALKLQPGNLEFQQALAGLDGLTPTAASQAVAAPATLTAQAPSSAGKAGGLLKEAAFLYSESRLKDAEEAWRRVLQLDPGNTVAAQGLTALEAERYKPDPDQPFDSTLAGIHEAAWKDIRKGRFLEARARVEEGLKLNPAHPQFKSLMAEVDAKAEKQKNSQAAADLCREGEALLKEGDLEAAGEKLNAALQADPGLEAAREALKKLRLRSGPKAQSLAAKGRKAMKAGDWEAARTCFKRSLALAPDPEISQALARAEKELDKSGQDALAREVATKETNQGKEALSAGDYARAEERFQAALKVEPSDSEAAKGLEQARARMAGQAREFEALIKDWQEEAGHLEDKGALEAALELHQKVLFKDARNVLSLKAKERLEKEIKR